jgi:hypothetical protein
VGLFSSWLNSSRWDHDAWSPSQTSVARDRSDQIATGNAPRWALGDQAHRDLEATVPIVLVMAVATAFGSFRGVLCWLHFSLGWTDPTRIFISILIGPEMTGQAALNGCRADHHFEPDGASGTPRKKRPRDRGCSVSSTEHGSRRSVHRPDLEGCSVKGHPRPCGGTW